MSQVENILSGALTTNKDVTPAPEQETETETAPVEA
jgi:hypothetical protein